MTETRRRICWYALLLLPLLGLLWAPLYNVVEPSLWGIPFFYWYQLAWIAVGALVTALVYFATREPKR